jgi:hypothetical protein
MALNKLHLVMLKDKPKSKHLELNFEHIMVLDKVYDPLVLFV